LLYIVQQEIQKNSDIKFAGVILKHPLVKEYMLKISTTKQDPQKILLDSIEMAKQYATDLAGMLKLTLGK
jgi:DNA-directed RNA polymerase subunit L